MCLRRAIAPHCVGHTRSPRSRELPKQSRVAYVSPSAPSLPPDIMSFPGEAVARAILCHIVMRTSTKVKTMEVLAQWLNERMSMMIHPSGNARKYQVLCASSVKKRTRFRLRTERRSVSAGLAFFQTNFYPSTGRPLNRSGHAFDPNGSEDPDAPLHRLRPHLAHQQEFTTNERSSGNITNI